MHWRTKTSTVGIAASIVRQPVLYKVIAFEGMLHAAQKISYRTAYIYAHPPLLYFMSRNTMIIFVIGILLLIYGYLCRLLSIYFFWDSKHFGWIIMVIGLMGFLIDQRKARVAQKKNIFFVRIGIGIIVFAFAIVGSAVMMIKVSNTYQDAINGLKKDGGIKSEIGTIRGVSLFPTGSGILDLVYSKTPGPSIIIVTVRGENEYRDVELELNRPLR